MRKYFIDSLVGFTKSKKNIYLILNDLGFNIIEPFKKKYPNKVYNAGVSEQKHDGFSSRHSFRKSSSICLFNS